MPRATLPADVTVGTVLREARRRKGLTCAEVGAAIGVHGNLIGLWERGGERLPAARRPQLAELFGLDPASLLPPDLMAVSAEEAELIGAFRCMDKDQRASLLRIGGMMVDGRIAA
ncbi:helix-turn-helix domain-containing protein [Methylobacterium sp. sgz302541]|uniref:helix-turn-helix domain-containing protein n=1 Tax=unclassified Methylobacterium TaxID=2615210 RepID=UPI003D34FE26